MSLTGSAMISPALEFFVLRDGPQRGTSSGFRNREGLCDRISRALRKSLLRCNMNFQSSLAPSSAPFLCAAQSRLRRSGSRAGALPAWRLWRPMSRRCHCYAALPYPRSCVYATLIAQKPMASWIIQASRIVLSWCLLLGLVPRDTAAQALYERLVVARLEV
jgi:hypothetical protein